MRDLFRHSSLAPHMPVLDDPTYFDIEFQEEASYCIHVNKAIFLCGFGEG
jgi:hypothetical protein